MKMLAFDFGASSGRAILGIFDGNRLVIEEIHRFTNEPVEVNGSLYWDILRLFYEIKQGILKCVQKGHRDIATMAVDTWGVDFGLLDGQGNLLGNPYHYRDKRTRGMKEAVAQIISKEDLYKKTGIEFMWFNTILQLYSMTRSGSPLLKEAKTLLLTPDLFNYFLTGVKATEYSIASTTQLLDARSGRWAEDIIEKLGLPGELFTDIIQPGSVIGALSKELSQELGISGVRVVAAAGHDTQSAIVAVPTEEEDFIYISCGTWSLMGVESESPIINEKSYKLSYTNEGGVGGKITLLKNIMGLWLIQECRKQWENDGTACSYAELEEMAGSAGQFVSFIDPGSEAFIQPGDMPERIREYCRKTGQPVPQTKGEIVRCIAQSLALKYKLTVESLEELLDRKLPVIHMVGGGIKDKLLCQLTANATGRRVIAGPVEATAIGNLMIQAMAAGQVEGLRGIRRVVKNSFPITVYEPQDTKQWDEACLMFKKVQEES
jgi:rhamnulokinase